MHRSKSKPLLSGWGQTTTSPLGSCVSFHQAADNSAPALRSPPRSTELMDSATCVCYALTTRRCLSGERYQSTAATSSNAGTSPTK